MNSAILFDIASKPFDWQSIQVSTGLFVGGCGAILSQQFQWGHTAIKNVGYFLIAIALVSSAFFSADWYISLRQNVRALTNGRFDVVEGTVENFRPMYYEGRPQESFTISGHTFRYSDRVITTCFNKPAAHGGPIRPGMALHIEFTDNCILRIRVL